MKDVFFHNFGFSIKSSHTLHWRPPLQFWEIEEAATERSSRFRPPKSCKEEVSPLECSKPKSTQYKDRWAVDGKLRARKNFLYLSRGVCSKIMMFNACKVLKKDRKTWTALPWTSGLQSWFAIHLVRCMELFVGWIDIGPEILLNVFLKLIIMHEVINQSWNEMKIDS